MVKPSKKQTALIQDETDLQEFNHSLPMSLLRAREAVMRKFTPFLRDHDLSPEQWRVIRALELEDGLELAELCKRSFLLAPSLTRIARNLEGRNLVKRKNVAEDQRRASLFLTAAGRKLFHQIAPDALEQYAYITDRFGTENLNHLYQLLDELVDSLNETDN